MKSSSFSLVFSLFFLFVQVTCLEIVIQPQTIAGGTSLAFWARDATDPPTFTMDLYFCGSVSVGDSVAFPDVTITSDQTFGAVPVVFPSAGTYTLKAVVSGTNQVLGVSNAASVVVPLMPVSPAPLPTGTGTSPLSSPTTAPIPLPTPTTNLPISSATPGPLPLSVSPTTTVQSPTPSHSPTTTTKAPPLPTTSKASPSASHSPVLAERRSVNLPAVVGGVVGGIVFLGLLVALMLFMIRRKKDAVRRYTFHQDMMVQPRNDDVNPTGPHVTVTQPNTFDHDLEAGPPPPPPVPSPGLAPMPPRIVVPASAPAFNSLRSDLVDRPHSPITPRTKRNFFAVANPNPFNPEAEAFASSRPAESSREAPLNLPNPYGAEPYNPFQDHQKEPEMVQVPPSPRMASSAFVTPSPRGPRPSIRR